MEHDISLPILVAILAGAATSLLPILIALGAGLVVLIPLGAYFDGYHVAQKEIKEAKPCLSSTPISNRCISIVDKQNVQGRFVAKSQTHVAIYENNRTTIHLIKDQQIVVEPPPIKPKKTTVPVAAQGETNKVGG